MPDVTRSQNTFYNSAPSSEKPECSSGLMEQRSRKPAVKRHGGPSEDCNPHPDQRDDYSLKQSHATTVIQTNGMTTV